MRKGQYTIVEQVILFALGISITLGFLFAFKDLTGSVRGDMKEVQSELVAEYVTSTSVELVESGAEGRMEMPVPERIASEPYILRMGSGGVSIQVPGEQSASALYGLGSRTDVDGQAESGRGAVTVTLADNQLELGGPE